MKNKLKRVCVVGTSCAGKSVLGGQIADAIGVRHVELDLLYWKPDWQSASTEEFRAKVTEATAGDEWVIDGNYGTARDILWGRATHVVWLNYPFRVVFRRALTRTIHRILTQQKVCGENRESFLGSFLHRDGIPWWVVRTHWARQKRYRACLDGAQYPHLEVIELANQREADMLVAKLNKTGGRPK